MSWSRRADVFFLGHEGLVTGQPRQVHVRHATVHAALQHGFPEADGRVLVDLAVDAGQLQGVGEQGRHHVDSHGPNCVPVLVAAWILSSFLVNRKEEG